MQKIFYCFLLLLTYIITYTSTATANENPNPSLKKNNITYTVSFSSIGDPNIAKLMEKHSQLIQLKEQLPDDKIGLQLRVKEDIITGKKLLASQGYYIGHIEQNIDWNQHPVSIKFIFFPNIQYTIDKTKITYKTPPDSLLPQNLSFFKISHGVPAIAENILTAVDNHIEYLHNNGYPLAKQEKAEYFIDNIEHIININIDIDQGPLMRMGKVIPQGTPNISTKFLNKLITWEKGCTWDNTLIRSYEDALQKTGLFTFITLKPGEKKDIDGTTPIELVAKESPPKTVSAGLMYSSDEGPGIRASWTHRNLFGNGENLTLTTPINKKNKQFLAVFRKPVFGSPKQTFIYEAEIAHKKTNAYNQKFLSTAIGLERKLNQFWSVTTKISFDKGIVDDKISSKDPFTYFGTPVSLKRDTSDDLLNPTKGTRLTLSTTPYIGKYKKRFTTLQNKIEISGYLTPLQSKVITLAGKLSLSSLLGKNTMDYPPALRFYAGGGGSIRGYKYQSIGPKNIRGIPLGGLSSFTVSFELRLKLTENIGIVPFIDGGNISKKQFPDIKDQLSWGTGIGFRYYSSIAPIRLDIATPLTNRKNNKSLQFYISIGQTF